MLTSLEWFMLKIYALTYATGGHQDHSENNQTGGSHCV